MLHSMIIYGNLNISISFRPPITFAGSTGNLGLVRGRSLKASRIRRLWRQRVYFLLLFVYLGTVAYISVEISLGSFWRRDILRVKGQGFITNCNFLWLCVTCNCWVATIWCALKYPWYLYFFSLSKCCCLHFCRIKFGLLLVQGYFKVKRSRIYHKLQLFMTLRHMQSSSGNYSMRH